MANRLAQAYHSLLDKLMEKDGYVTEEKCIEVFGGIPKFANVGMVGMGCTTIFSPKRKYIQLGPFENAYQKIVQAGKTGTDKLTLAKSDFNGSATLVYLFELNSLQEQSKDSGRKSVLRDIELDFDYESLWPEITNAPSSKP